MRIAIATENDQVSSRFGCCPACTIVEIEDGRRRNTLTVPNPGCQHAFWMELMVRNSITCLIAGNIGEHARSVLKGAGIEVIAGAEGPIDAVIKKYAAGAYRSDAEHSGRGRLELRIEMDPGERHGLSL